MKRYIDMLRPALTVSRAAIFPGSTQHQVSLLFLGGGGAGEGKGGMFFLFFLLLSLLLLPEPPYYAHDAPPPWALSSSYIYTKKSDCSSWLDGWVRGG